MPASWLHPNTRAALYKRDNHACVYCLKGRADGVLLTADHVRPVSLGGTNAVTNLVTACFSCNSAKQDKKLSDWLAYMAKAGFDANAIGRRVRNARSRIIRRVRGNAQVRQRRCNAPQSAQAG